MNSHHKFSFSWWYTRSIQQLREETRWEIYFWTLLWWINISRTCQLPYNPFREYILYIHRLLFNYFLLHASKRRKHLRIQHQLTAEIDKDGSKRDHLWSLIRCTHPHIRRYRQTLSLTHIKSQSIFHKTKQRNTSYERVSLGWEERKKYDLVISYFPSSHLSIFCSLFCEMFALSSSGRCED